MKAFDKKLIIISGILLFLIGIPVILKANLETDDGHGKKLVKEFAPGEFIFDHIGDAYDWHILSFTNKRGKEVHISIPLPIILYSSTTGMHLFLSTKFHHGHSAHKGFKISNEGQYKGKIVEVHEDGEASRPLDLSLTKNAFAIMLSIGLILLIFIPAARAYQKNPVQAPKGAQLAIEPIIIFVRDEIAKPSIGEKNYERYMPFLLSIFFFIWINNLLGLIPIIPGGANVTGNITVTMALALFTFMVTNIKANKHYWLEIFNAPGMPWWLKIPIPLVPIIEIMGMVIKPFVLMVRLFANITAGHIIIMGFFTLIFIFGNMRPSIGFAISPLSVFFTIFMTFLELLVALIQAYVFTLLSALYFGMASSEHH